MTHHSLKPHSELIACPACDALYQRPKDLRAQEKLLCTACGTRLIDGRADFRQAFIFTLTALILFIIANSFPFITLSMRGEITTISVFSSVRSLFDNALPMLGVVVMLFIMVLPLYYLSAILWVIISFRFQFMHRLTRRFLHWLHHISPWNMLEVYLLGVVVTLVKIMTMASVKFESGFWAFAALIFCSILIESRFDVNDAIFQAYEEHDN